MSEPERRKRKIKDSAIYQIRVQGCLEAVWSDRLATAKMKYSTEIPANVITPDTMETRIGTLNFVSGLPTKETAQKVWDQLDFSRAVEAMIMTTPAASLQGFRKGIQKWGPDNETMIVWKGRLDSKGKGGKFLLVPPDYKGENRR